jgi:hypothetical protein
LPRAFKAAQRSKRFEVRGSRFKTKSTPQREHDATATGWEMAEGLSVNHFPFELVATATVFDVVETSVA